METSYFSILKLRPGRYTSSAIDRQYDAVRAEILRAGGPDRQRRLDDAFIARTVLRNPARQVVLLDEIAREVTRRPRRATRSVSRRAVSGRPALPAPTTPRRPPNVGTRPRGSRVTTGQSGSGQTVSLGTRSPSASRKLRMAPDAPAPADRGEYYRFARMVQDNVSGGILRFSSRQRLLAMATGLGIGPFKANLIIAEVLHDICYGHARAGLEVTGPLAEKDPAWLDRWRRRLHAARFVLAAAVTALAIDLLVLWWLSR